MCVIAKNDYFSRSWYSIKFKVCVIAKMHKQGHQGCKWYSLCSGQWQHLCSSFIGSFCSFWHCWPPNSPFLLNSVFGIQSTAFQWFQSYFSDRYQSTSVNNLSSSPSQLIYSVPQGSVLGPILFVLYTTPLSDVIANNSVNHQLFADDAHLQISLLSVKNLMHAQVT